MLSCVGPIYVYLGSQLSDFVTGCFSTWTKKWELEGKPVEDKETITTPLLRKSNVSFRYKELADATAGFNKKHCIGVGGFAKVYKAVLPDSRVVAVKRLYGRGKQSDREFRAEIDTVGKVHHKNLVQLLGYCRTKEGKLLVYEFFEHGSLNKYLRSAPAGKKEVHLDWDMRLNIALGAAEGLAYLHSCEPRIIHRDVKSSNILLGKHFEAKVSDFGLARLIDPAKTHVTTFIAGTKAYIAPEYQKSLRLTVKCDVYSYGVVLLELLTGKDPSASRNFDLIAWVKRRMSSCYEFFDVRMLDSGDKDSMSKVLDLALQCTKTSPKERPTMDEVVVILKNLLKTPELEDGTLSDDEASIASLQEYDEKMLKIIGETDAAGLMDTSTAMEDDVFPSKGLDTHFERLHMPRVVSTPILSDVLKQSDDTRAVVTIEDVRVESHLLTLGLLSGDSDLTSTSESNEKLCIESAVSLPNDQVGRRQSFG